MSQKKNQVEAATLVSGLAPYTGSWTHVQAAHLLRRACFGPTLEEIAAVEGMGMDAAVNNLFASIPLPDPPVNHFYTEDSNVPVGETWINQPFRLDLDVGEYRWPSLRGWLYDSVQEGGMNLREKMMFFWNNHFGMADVGDHRMQYQYVTLFREQATGNFKNLVRDVTIAPSMLRFLNGEYSNRWAPNENYARELLELFTIGKGPLVAPGDYSNYTETDVAEMARVLTGWRNSSSWAPEPIAPYSYFFENWHDPDTKVLSHRFDNIEITNEGENEFETLLDIIFAKDEVSRFIVRKLYRYFVYYKIDATVEAQVIEPLAQILRDNNYELEPVLSTLLRSQHFYDSVHAGDVIKNPVEFVLSIVRPLRWGRTNFPLELRYQSGNALHWWAIQLGIDFFYPPSVSGWPAWYLEPSFNRLWLNSSTLQQRTRLTNDVGWSGIWVAGSPRAFDWFGFIATIDNASNPNVLIETLAKTFFSQPLYQTQLDELKNFLIPGLPDFEWSDEYGAYLGGDTSVTTSVENKLKSLFRALFRMAEFHLN